MLFQKVFKWINFYFLVMNDLIVSTSYVCLMPAEAEGIGSPGIGATEDCEPTEGHWELT